MFVLGGVPELFGIGCVFNFLHEVGASFKTLSHGGSVSQLTVESTQQTVGMVILLVKSRCFPFS